MLISLRKNRSLHLTGTAFFESRTDQDYRLLRNNEETIMFYALSWSVVFSLLTLWSLAAWAFHSITAWTVSNAGALTGAASGVEGLRLPEWLAPWVPPEIVQAMTSLLSGLAPAVESLFQAAPALAGGLTVATWVIWGLGSVLLVLVGAGLHLLIAMWRRRGVGSGPQPHLRVTA
ncbi:MAG: hypothetical protein WB775_17950 [Burkholderiaceae bacterium]